MFIFKDKKYPDEKCKECEHKEQTEWFPYSKFCTKHRMPCELAALRCKEELAGNVPRLGE